MGNSTPRGGLLSHVYKKIESVFGTENPFTHHDFEEFLGKDKSKDRNRISVRLVFLWKHGALKKVDEKTPTAKSRRHGVYQAVRFPLCVLKQAESQDAFGKIKNIETDSVFLNLGKKKQKRSALPNVGNITSKTKAANVRVHRLL